MARSQCRAPQEQLFTTRSEQRALSEGAAAQRYVWTPDPLIITFAYDPLTVGIYVAVARLAFAARGAVPLAARDLASWMGSDFQADRAAIMRRIVKLAEAGWLVVDRRSTLKNRLIPTWGPDQKGVIRPWSFDSVDSGKPAHLRGRRVPLTLFDDYVGRLDPQPDHHRALISRYLTRPLLDLTDIGVYTIGLRVETAGTPRLSHLGLHTGAGMRSPMPSKTLLTCAALGGLTTLVDDQAAVVELTVFGQARLGALEYIDTESKMEATIPASGSPTGSGARSEIGSIASQYAVVHPGHQNDEKSTSSVPSSLIAWEEGMIHEQTNHDSTLDCEICGGGIPVSLPDDYTAEQAQTLQLTHMCPGKTYSKLSLPSVLDSDVLSGHLALNAGRLLQPGEWHELAILQQLHGIGQLLIWQARAHRRLQPHPFGITPGYYQACAVTDATETCRPSAPLRTLLEEPEPYRERWQTTSIGLDPTCDMHLRAMGIRERKQLAGVSLDLILAWQSILTHPGLAVRFTSPLGFAVSQLRYGNAPPSVEELERWEKQPRRSIDRYDSWRHIAPQTGDPPAHTAETDLEVRVRAIAPLDADLATLCEIARLIEAGLSDQETLVQVCKDLPRGAL